MELPEAIDKLNYKLHRTYGDDLTGRVIYRVVWAEDQRENRLTEYDDHGNQLVQPEVRLLPKYQWIVGKYILEKLMYIANPESQKELAGQVLSYECIFAFEDAAGNPLPPLFDVCQLVISTMEAAMKGGGFVKYKSDDTPEKRLESINKLQAELFGNETDTTDAMAHKDAIVVPSKYGVH